MGSEFFLRFRPSWRRPVSISRTSTRNRDYIEKLIDYFGPFIRIDEIDVLHDHEVQSGPHQTGLVVGETARRQIVVPLKAVLNHAFGLRSETREVNRRMRILTPEEAERLIEAAMHPPETVRDPHRRLLKMIAFLFGSGATPGEMFCVRAEDINRATSEVWIRGTEPGAGKTPYRARMVRLPARAWDLIGELPDEGRVFLTTNGKEVVPDGKRGSTVIRQFHKLCAAAGLSASEPGEEELVLYSLRHAWATNFSAQVGDQDLLIDRGGWASADMARHYRKRAPADLGERLLAHGWDFRP